MDTEKDKDMNVDTEEDFQQKVIYWEMALLLKLKR